MKSKLLSLLIAATIAAGVAQAGENTPAPGTPQQQAARAEIDRLVKRIEELSRQLGDDSDVRVIVRRGRGDRPEAFEWEGPGGDREVVIKRLGRGDAPIALPGKDGERKLRIERHGPGDEHGFGQRPGLGIVMAPNTAANGVRVAAVTPDSPAMKAGIRSGDVLLVVDGKAISGSGEAGLERARELLGRLKQDQIIKLRYARQGKTHDASIKADSIRRVMSFSRDGMAPKARMQFEEGRHFEHRDIEHLLPPGVELDIERIGPRRDCGKGKKDCGLPVIYEAFRWQGLNLASIDRGLGRYFGTEKGVLVLSSGEELKGLQSGDVIQRVGGVAVDSPRDVMRALRDKDSGSQLKLDLMRDRRATAVTVTVPKSRPLPFISPPPAPPAPPAPPMAPRAPHAAPPAPHAAPALPPHPPRAAPPAPPSAPTPPPPPRDDAVFAPPALDGQVYVFELEGRERDQELKMVLAPAS